ncbi:MAG: hypothetical protein GY757_08680 [bacterium]|nr:hypothetical protein [bacterium]
MGKTALMERLFNITFHKNDGVIPFYYEVKETEMWAVDFCRDFFLTFIYQYIAFKSRKKEYLVPGGMSDFEKAIGIAQKVKELENVAGALGFIFSPAALQTKPKPIAKHMVSPVVTRLALVSLFSLTR